MDVDPFLRRSDPYPFYAELRRRAPVAFAARRNLWVVSRYEDVRTVLSDHAIYSSAVMGDGGLTVCSPEDGSVLAPRETLLASDPPVHTRLRRCVVPYLTARYVRRYEATIRAAVDASIRRVAPDGSCDFVADICRPATIAVMADLLDLSHHGRAKLGTWLDALVGATTVSPSSSSTYGPDIDELLRECWREAEKRLGGPGGDLLTGLMRAKQEGAINAAQVLNLCVILLQGGADTTTCLTANTLLALHRHASIRARCVTDAEVLPRVIDECLRHDAPVQSAFRVSTTATELGGTPLPAGCRIMALLGSANRDESAFEDPEQFRLRLGGRGAIAFGAGPHRCPGEALARLQARIVVETVLTRMPDFDVDLSSLERIRYFKLRGPRRMTVTFEPFIAKN